MLNFIIQNSVKLMIIIGMFLLMFTTKNHFPKHIRKYTVALFISILAYSIVSSIDVYITELDHPSFDIVMIRRVASFLGYGLRPFIIVFATFILQDMSSKRKWLFSIPAFANVAFHLTGLWSGIVSTIDKDNDFVRGPLGYISFVVSGLYVLYLIYLALSTIIKKKQQRGYVILFIVVCSVISAVFDVIAETTSNYLGNALCVSILFYYLYLHVEYADRYESKLKKSQENELVLSQVRPHFMYNVLTSIYYLCDHDPQKAKYAVNEFSKYLRNNLDTIRGHQLVSFGQELNYVQNYLALEKIRFEDELTYEFDIQANQFFIPKFTLQPLVENAVKHGITQKEGGGHLIVYTKEEEDYYVVGVKDNGVGFDPSIPKNDGRSHTGLSNISSRLIDIINEDLHIESKIGSGTHIYFYIPKKLNK